MKVLKNPEKDGKHEKWDKERDMLNFPSPFRMLLLGGVNSGKTNTVKNIIARIYPPFRNIYLLHCGGEFTKEYDEIDYECLETVPTPDDKRFDGKEKSCLIIEDKAFDHATRLEKKAIGRLFGYMSTHRNLSIFLTSQNFFDVPTAVRRMSNVYILWNVRDQDMLKTMARRIGITGKAFIDIFKDNIQEYTDSIWFDLTPHTPYPLRKNGYTVLDLDSYIE